MLEMFSKFQQQFQTSYYAVEIHHKALTTDSPTAFSFSSETGEALSGRVLTSFKPAVHHPRVLQHGTMCHSWHPLDCGQELASRCGFALSTWETVGKGLN